MGNAPLAMRSASVLAGHQFHHQIVHTVELFEPVDRRDVGMIQRRQHSRFALEARQALWIVCELPGKNLDSYVATKLGVARLIHFAHAARAEQGDHLVGAHLAAH